MAEFMGVEVETIEIDGEEMAPVSEKVTALIDFIAENSATDEDEDLWILAVGILASIADKQCQMAMH